MVTIKKFVFALPLYHFTSLPLTSMKLIKQFYNFKKSRKKITMLTAYDYPMARILDEVGIDIILVGDSLANVVLGLEKTKQVGMTEMIHHAKAVRRAVKNAFVVGDMPFSAYQSHPGQAVLNAKRFMKEAGCDAVKIEWFDRCLDVTKKMIKSGIPVMGHVGLTPQTADRLGGLKVQGRDAQSAKRIINNAVALDEAGVFSIVLECIPTEIAKIITKKVKCPTIGIGAGKFCNGQVLVTYDLLGLSQMHIPKFVKQYANLHQNILQAVTGFKKEVVNGKFPDKAHSYSIDKEELIKIRNPKFEIRNKF